MEPPSFAQFAALRAATWRDVDFLGARLRVLLGRTRSARRWIPLVPETIDLLDGLLAPEDREASLASSSPSSQTKASGGP